MPAPPNIRQLSLASLNEAGLRELIQHGEDLLVERKRQPPEPPKFGAAVASFANTLGGWLLLGVDDDAAVSGWETPSKLDLQSHLGSVLAKEVDPLPPFVAAMREVDGKPVGVIRVFPSADVPHIVRGTGAVYVRSAKGKEPIDDHRTLLEIARRGSEAELEARVRLAQLPPVGDALRPPDWQPPGVAFAKDIDLRYIIRAAPITVTPAFREWPITQTAADCLATTATGLLPPPPPMMTRQLREAPAITPFARGVTVEDRRDYSHGTPDTVTVVADAGGVIGIAISRSHIGDQFSLHLESLDTEILRPAAAAMTNLLADAEACGRVAIDLWMVRPDGALVRDAVGERWPKEVQLMRDVTIPARDDDVEQLARSWHREIRRAFGIPDYEPSSAPGPVGRQRS